MSAYISGTFFQLMQSGLLLVFLVEVASPQSTSTLMGRVIDPSERVVPGAAIVVRNIATHVQNSGATNAEGFYEFPVLPVGKYRLQVRASGFRLYTIEELTTEVAGTFVHDVHLTIGDVSEEITVRSRSARSTEPQPRWDT